MKNTLVTGSKLELIIGIRISIVEEKRIFLSRQVYKEHERNIKREGGKKKKVNITNICIVTIYKQIITFFSRIN